MKESRIVLGTWAWGAGAAGGDQVFGSHTDTSNLKPVFDAAIEQGLNVWDTATVYGMGSSESILGSLVAGLKREDIVLSTKFTPQIASMYGDSVERMAEASLERLGTDYIDIYWIHNPMDVERWTPQLLPLLRSSKVKHVGVSNHNVDEIERANAILAREGYRVSAVQNHFSLLYRSSERGGVLDYCKRNDMEFWGYMVLEQGALAGGYNPEHPLPADSARGQKYNPVLGKLAELTDVMKEIGQAHGASCSQVAIAYVLNKGIKPLVGATKTKHVAEAAAALNVVLTDEEVDRLEKLADNIEVDTRGDWEHPME